MGLRIKQPWWLKTQGIITLIAVFALAIQPVGGFVAGQIANAISTVIYVDASSSTAEDGSISNPYDTIAEALDAASAGDTIDIAADTYNEDVTIGKSLVINGQAGTTINGKITITGDSDDVTLTNLTINYHDEAAVKIPSEISLNSLTLDGLNIASPKSVYAADSKELMSTIGTLNIKNSTITSNYPVYVDHVIDSLNVTSNVFNIGNLNRGVVFAKQSAGGSVSITGNTFNAAADANLDDMNFVKYESADNSKLQAVLDNNTFANPNSATPLKVKISSDNKAIIVDNSPTGLSSTAQNGSNITNSSTNVDYIRNSWNAVDGAVSYNYEFSKPNGLPTFSRNQTDTFVQGSFQNPNNSPEGQYAFRVQAVFADNALSEWSEWSNVIYDATDATINSVNINDTAVDNNVGNDEKVDMNNPYHVGEKFTVSAIYDDATSGVRKGNVDIANVKSTGASVGGNIGVASTATRTQLDDGKWQYNYTIETDKISEDGVYMLKIRAWDKAGNLMAKHIAVNIDRNAPDAPTITSPGVRTWHKATPIRATWTPVETDTAGIKEYQIQYIYADGGTFAGSSCDGTNACREVPGTQTFRDHKPGTDEQGKVTIKVRAIDNAGNLGDWSKAVYYYYDNEDPTLTNFSYPTGVVNKIIVSGGVNDNMGIGSIRLQLNNWDEGKRYGGVVQLNPISTISLVSSGVSSDWSYEYDIDSLNLPDGQYSVTAKAVDKAGNLHNIDWTSAFTLDTTAPVIDSFQILQNGKDLNGKMTNQREVDVVWGSNDIDIDYYQYHNKNGWNIYEPGKFVHGDIGGTDGEDGLYEYKLRAVDYAGNFSEEKTVSVTLDTNAPVVTLDKSLNGKTLQGPVDIVADIEDDSVFQYYITVKKNGTDITNNLSFDRKVPGRTTFANEKLFALNGDGDYTVMLEARDTPAYLTGNKDANSTKIISFTIDNKAPNAPVITPNGDEVPAKGQFKVTVDSAATDGGTINYGNVTIKDAGGSPINHTRVDNVYTINTLVMNKGAVISITAVSTDAVGNTRSITEEYKVNNGTPGVTDGDLSNDAEGNFVLNGTSGFGEGADVTVVVNGLEYTGETNAGGDWSIDVGQLEAETRYTFNVAISNTLGYVNDTLVASYVTPAVDTELVGGAFADAVTFIPGETEAIEIAGGESTEPTVLGAEDEAVMGDSASNTAALTTSDEGWKLFGAAWYWWLAALAVIGGGLWWLAGAIRRKQTQEI